MTNEEAYYGLIITSWLNRSLGGLHCYVKAWREVDWPKPKREEWEVYKVLSVDDAWLLNELDGINSYVEGEKTYRFNNKQEAIYFGEEFLREKFGDDIYIDIESNL